MNSMILYILARAVMIKYVTLGASVILTMLSLRGFFRKGLKEQATDAMSVGVKLDNGKSYTVGLREHSAKLLNIAIILTFIAILMPTGKDIEKVKAEIGVTEQVQTVIPSKAIKKND